MYRKILVPLDGSDFSEQALPLALSVAEVAGGELQLVTAVPTLPPVVPSSEEKGQVKGWFEEERSRATEYLEAIRKHLTAGAADVPIHIKVLTGGPARAIEDRIRQTGADLVVMTTHGRGPLERVWLGSVADGLIRTSPCPILLWRPSEEGPDPEARQGFSHVLVPLDGSPESEAILPEAAGLARLFGADLRLLSVVPGLFPLGSTYIPHAAEETRQREEHRGEFEAYLDDVGGRLREEGLKVVTQTVFGDDPPRKILEVREEVGADLVALSTRGRGGVARLVMGSTADKVIRAGQVPILVHRHPHDEDQ